MGRASNRKWARRAGRIRGMQLMGRTQRALEYLARLGSSRKLHRALA